eukprot:COSAG06_NODE_14337_length_1165_cov_2.369606_2_plen_59_part_00
MPLGLIYDIKWNPDGTWDKDIDARTNRLTRGAVEDDLFDRWRDAAELRCRQWHADALA